MLGLGRVTVTGEIVHDMDKALRTLSRQHERASIRVWHLGDQDQCRKVRWFYCGIDSKMSKECFRTRRCGREAHIATVQSCFRLFILAPSI